MATNDHGEHAPIDRKADITIVGGGLAGLAACIEVATRNPSLSIVLVEKEGKLGGNSAKASSGINAALNDDDAPVFEKDTLESGTGLAARSLVDVFVRNSRDAIAFLEKQGHVDLSVLSQLGGHSAKRTHRNTQGPNVGFAIVSALQKLITDHIESHDWHIDVVTSASAEQVLFENDRVTGLVIDRVDKTGRDEGAGEPLRETIESSVVILATGGYSANPELLKKFAPGVEDFPTTNGPWARGDGIGLAQQLGAELVLMDKVQLHPTAFINPKDRSAKHKFLAPEAIRGSGALLINSSGKRFVNELATRDKVAAAILAQPSKDAYMLLFEGAKDMETTLGFYKHMGLVQVAHSIEEAAALCHVDAFVLQQTLNDYAEVSHSQQPDAFGKTVFPHPLHYAEDVTSHMEIHVMEVAPAVHYTMGGVKINEHAQVLRSDDSAIAGLYAAGEVSGGLHGANRLGGNSLAECVVFGRIAAQQAVQQLAH
uniref:fumarate reductase (NADH) n=1 Tax=Globisporangium ultimum (strain ATCC 200006 / CBS 805.95 / DAOM BR144) TaxID=431595 RepID=K3WEF2_GLOUD